MDTPRVILRSPWAGPWRSFRNPSAILEARTIGDVRRVLADVDAAVARTGHVAAGFVTYDAAGAFDLPASPPRGDSLPLAWFGLFAPGDVESLDQITPAGTHEVGEWRPSISHDDYRRGVARIRERIEAGDTYQINYTWRLRAQFRGDPLSLLVHLDAAQGGAWSACVDLGGHVVCSASPELFFLRDGAHVECRPMKGTASRGLSADDDRARRDALHASAKNRAENVMIADMTRNDLGRIARTGSVRTETLFAVERYPPQWQMVSTIAAQIEDGSMASLFGALFPPGSVTGAPKHRSMSIIGELETEPRGIYTGAIGMFGQDRAHFNVAIRTVHIDRMAGTAEFGVGSGIVWDSVDEDEYEECRTKASILSVSEPSPEFELLETLSWARTTGFVLLEGHLERLRRSAEYFGFSVVDPTAVRSALDREVAGRTAAQRVRLLVSRGGGIRVESTELVPLPEPRRAALAREPIAAGDRFLYHKTTNRGVYEKARQSRPDVDAVILWNADGEVTEGTDANIVAEIDGRQVTPPVACGLLPGVLRAALLAGGEIEERRVTVADLRAARAVWLINSVRGWMRVELMDA